MRKRLLLMVVCVLCLLFSGYTGGTMSDGETRVMGKYPVYIDGRLDAVGYWVEETAYVPLRSLCDGFNLGATVVYNPTTATMTVTMGEDVLTARVGDVYLYVNDRIVYLEQPIRQVHGNVVVPLLPVTGAFGVTAEETAEGLRLYTAAMELCQSGSRVYDPTDLKWLSHIIHAEAGNQSLEGQICVGNVVLNRVADDRFPDTVQAVIFSPNQFCPVKSGTIYCTPDAEAVAAAKLCLEGVNLAGESTYFVNPKTGSTAWFRENLTYAMSVGDHDFYF